MHKQLSTSFSHHLVQAMALRRHKTKWQCKPAQAQVTAQAQDRLPAQDQEQIQSQSPPQAQGYVQG